MEVIGRIRDHPNRKDGKPTSVLQVDPDRRSVRLRTDFGYRDFSLDGVSSSEEEDLEDFYRKFVESRIRGVKLGDKCTVMMYGPTGSGKSHTMFGCSKQPGIVYKSLKDILGDGDGNETSGTFVQVTVLEIYNEEIYDLLSNNCSGGFGFSWSKGSASKVRLEVMGKKAKNATFISGNEAGKISKEIQKVEKRRIVKSTLCNERSSRSHCMIILDVPTVGGRLMLVDMAGSENIEQAGVGFEAKLQTGKINQGNIALKRVVESIANGDAHLPFRDSKLTMLLQDSFEDDKSKILMILCASPDPKDIHKTISTLEYGAKAKSIVRGPHTPTKEKMGSEDSSTLILGSRITAMDQFIYKLQIENKLREKERNEAQKELLKKEEEVAQLRAKLEVVEVKGSSEEEINLKVDERTQFLKSELERKVMECQKMANEFVELGRRRMEEKILQQQQEVEMLRRRLEEIESEISHSGGSSIEVNGQDIDGSGFAKRLMDVYADEDPGMVKSMDLDTGDQESYVHSNNFSQLSPLKKGDEDNEVAFVTRYGGRVGLSTVFEEEELEGEEHAKNAEDEEVKKVIEENTGYSSGVIGEFSPNFTVASNFSNRNLENVDVIGDGTEEKHPGLGLDSEIIKDGASSRQMRIQNIFTLCGNYRELHQYSRTATPAKMSSMPDNCRSSSKRTIGEDPPAVKLFPDENFPPQNPLTSLKKVNDKSVAEPVLTDAKTPHWKSCNPVSVNNDDLMEVYVKWEGSKENPGKFVTSFQVGKESSLSDLRKLIEIYLGADKQQQAFTFLVLGDPTGAPVTKEKEAVIPARELPVCNTNELHGHLACLRPTKGIQFSNHGPLSRLPLSPKPCFTRQDECLLPSLTQDLNSSPYINALRH